MNNMDFEALCDLDDSGSLPDDYEIQGWDSLRERLSQTSNDASYMVLSERKTQKGGPEQSERIDRFDFTVEQVQTLLTSHEFEGIEDWPIILEGAERWLLHTALQHCLGCPLTRLRLRVYGPGGQPVLYTKSFTIKHTPLYDTEEDDLSKRALMVETDSATAELQAMVTAKNDVGVMYSQQSHLIFRNFKALVQMMKDVFLETHQMQKDTIRQLVDSQKAKDRSNETMFKQVLDFRSRAVEDKELRVQEQLKASKTSDAVKVTVDRAAQTVESLFAHKMLPEKLQSFLKEASGNPVLMQALDDPDLELMLKDPKKTQYLMGLLKQLAPQMRERDEQVASGTPGRSEQSP